MARSMYFPIRRVTAQGYSPLINDIQPFVSNSGSITLSFVAAYPLYLDSSRKVLSEEWLGKKFNCDILF